MFGKTSHLNPLTSRKKLLEAESELNRAQLVQDWRMMAGEAHALADQARTVRAAASTAAALVTSVAALRQRKPASASEKPSWLRTLLKGAGQAATLWSLLSLQRRDRDAS